MEENEKMSNHDELFTRAIRAGKRTYFFVCEGEANDFPRIRPCSPVLHGNTRCPELQDKASPGALVVQFGTPSRIAKHPGCSKSTASYALAEGRGEAAVFCRG